MIRFVPEQSARSKGQIAYWGWLLSAVLLAGIVWVVPLGEVWRSLLRANPLLLVVAMGPVVVNLWLRGFRWALLFRPRFAISSQAALGPTLIGMGLNAVLPGRVGEIARVAIASRQLRTGFAFTAATVVGERLLDALTLLAFLGGSLLLLPSADARATVDFLGYSFSAETLHRLARRIGLATALLIGLTLSLLIPCCRRLLAGAVGALPFIGAKAEGLLVEISQGLTILKRPKTLSLALALSFLIWLALALTNLLVSKAMPGIDLNLRQALILTSVSVAVSAIPSAPGAWGVFEAGALLALALVRVTPEAGDGAAYAFATHLCQYLPVVALGAAAGFRLRIRRQDHESRRATRIRDG